MRNDNPQFCIIAPTEYLKQYASQSSMHLVLAHLVDTDNEYTRFYRDRDEYKIMDNGAFELGESYAPEKLIELGRKCKAHAIVLPDYPGNAFVKTMTAAEELAPKVIDNGFQTFFCPQSVVGDLNGWIQSYNWASENDDIDIIGMSILGIPNALPHIPKCYARVVMTQLLIDRGDFNFDKHHHYLGANAGMALEVPSLIRMNALDSCDSSNPVWQGLLGHRYAENTDSYSPTCKAKFEVQFDYPMTKDVLALDNVQHNIDLTLGLFNEETLIIQSQFAG